MEQITEKTDWKYFSNVLNPLSGHRWNLHVVKVAAEHNRAPDKIDIMEGKQSQVLTSFSI